MKETKKRRLNKQKLLILMSIILVLILIVVFYLNSKKSDNDDKQTSNVIDTVSGYTLDDNETAYYKNLFNQLKGELNKTEIDEEKYATLISQLFISDFLTLSNKINKNDIGGIQFIYKDYRKNFEKSAKESIYHTVESNIYGDRKQELPTVHSIEVVKVTSKSYNYLNKNDDNAYYISLQVTYEKDLGYQKNVNLILVHNNELLEIVKMSNN